MTFLLTDDLFCGRLQVDAILNRCLPLNVVNVIKVILSGFLLLFNFQSINFCLRISYPRKKCSLLLLYNSRTIFFGNVVNIRNDDKYLVKYQIDYSFDFRVHNATCNSVPLTSDVSIIMTFTSLSLPTFRNNGCLIF